ncbi:hypothetical protein WN48_06183 [Eufriesea mexicana]|uniref:Uncharacterized protein n=1 Tax=Eufriesea mexicana TaxID=516756 RepID=A0A310STS4_9HYME|nr:hypothetical protein WN48_06183 [Eufriesea mexicana]
MGQRFGGALSVSSNSEMATRIYHGFAHSSKRCWLTSIPVFTFEKRTLPRRWPFGPVASSPKAAGPGNVGFVAVQDSYGDSCNERSVVMPRIGGKGGGAEEEKDGTEEDASAAKEERSGDDDETSIVKATNFLVSFFGSVRARIAVDDADKAGSVAG